MKSAICTLYEGTYHLGVAALINSIANRGFRGDIFVGYRGELPEWCDKATVNSSLEWEGAKTLTIYSDLKVHFLPIVIKYHMANYKAEFMLQLFAGPCMHIDGLAYFDPDIVIKCNWSFFETWMSHGVALVHEIVNNDMPPSHPIRKEWAKVAALCNRSEARELTSYINSGFFGVPRSCIEILELMTNIREVARTHFHVDDQYFEFSNDRSNLFYAGDQDVLNIAAMYCQSPISEMGPEAMDFTHGGFTMSHAVGSPKPWSKKFFSAALKGLPPSMAEKTYWENVNGPIKIFTASKVKNTLRSIKAASAIGRFYKRS
jgi:hypothetical protein